MDRKRLVSLLSLLCCGILAVLAYLCKFVFRGYSFSALICCGLIGIILFYKATRLLRPRWPKGIRMLRAVFTVCLLLGLTAALITEGFLIRASFGDPGRTADYVVVLGAKVRATGPSQSLWDRLYAARDYLLAHPDTVAVVSGGQGADEPESEAQAMYTVLTGWGIPPERVWIEDRATSTWENLNFSLELIEEKTGSRPDTLGVVSSEYHLFRSGLFARACGVEFIGVPARTSRITQKVNHFLREIAGVWHFLILGGSYD